MCRQMAFGTKVDVSGDGESRARSSRGGCAQDLDSYRGRMDRGWGGGGVTTAEKERVLRRRERSTEPATEKPLSVNLKPQGGWWDS